MFEDFRLLLGGCLIYPEGITADYKPGAVIRQQHSAWLQLFKEWLISSKAKQRGRNDVGVTDG